MQWRTTLPLYDFIDTNTGEEFSELMSMSAREDYLKSNPHVQQVHLGAPAMVSGTGTFKNDNGWKENLSRIAEAHPNSALAEKQGGRSSTKVMVDNLAKKHGYGKSGNYKMKELSN
jgi:hypothetical protein